MKLFRFLWVFLGFALIMAACAHAQAAIISTQTLQPTAIASPTTTPDWFDMELTDVQTGKTFALKEYAGKVVLVETMEIWCPNCIVRATQVTNLHELLGNPDDLVSKGWLM